MLPSSPRARAERLLAECHRLAASPNDETVPLFLDLAEKAFAEAEAFDMEWLAGYLAERARRLRGYQGVTAAVARSLPRRRFPPGASP